MYTGQRVPRYEVGVKAFVPEPYSLQPGIEPRFYFGTRKESRDGVSPPALDILGGRLDLTKDANEMAGLSREAMEEGNLPIIVTGPNAPIRIGTQFLHYGNPRRHVLRKLWLAVLAPDAPVDPVVPENSEFISVELLTIRGALERGVDQSLELYLGQPANLRFLSGLQTMGNLCLSEIKSRLVELPATSYRATY